MTTHGLPDELERLYGLARLKRTIHSRIEEAIQKALAAGYSVDRVDEILQTTKYPPPGADEQWLKGWFAAESGAPVPKGGLAYSGYQSWLSRHS